MTPADPVGGLVSRQHGEDARDAAAPVPSRKEPLQREGWSGAIPQQVFQALKIARHIAVDERDPDTGIDRKPVVSPGEHVGGGSGVEEVPPLEPADHAATHPLVERGQIDLSDRPHRQARRRRRSRTRGLWGLGAHSPSGGQERHHEWTQHSKRAVKRTS